MAKEPLEARETSRIAVLWLLAGLDGELVGRTGDAGQAVALFHVVVEQRLVVDVLDVIARVPVLDLARTGDALALAAGVGKVPALVLAGVEDGLVVGDLDGLALLGELDLVVLDLVLRDGLGVEAFLFFLFRLLALREFPSASPAGMACGRTATDRAVVRLREVGLRNGRGSLFGLRPGRCPRWAPQPVPDE